MREIYDIREIGPSTPQCLMHQALRFLLFGEGETGLMVYAILLR